MNWGVGIVLAFFGFTSLIVTLVVISMRQDVNLVARDYYQQEIAYQDQIDRMNNYRMLKTKPSIIHDQSSQKLLLDFTNSIANDRISGSILIFRPSGTAQDRRLTLDLDTEGDQLMDLSGLQKGKWKFQLTWSYEQKEYYHEKIILVQ